jgi:NADPH:quinone reductase-like Zn-dependent oxidoreductase
MVGGDLSLILLNMLLKPLIFRTRSNDLGLVPWKPNDTEDLTLLKELFEAGKVVPIIDRRFPLSELPEALRYLEEGRALGKVVISVAQTDAQ